jgi:hypothetical protein
LGIDADWSVCNFTIRLLLPPGGFETRPYGISVGA